MPKHTVKQGECLTSIAAHYGFGDPSAIWNDPSNAKLKQLRGDDGHLLHPGDVITIPDRSQKKLSLSPGDKKDVKVKRPERRLSFAIVDGKNAPVANADYTLHVDGEDLSGKTDGQGKLEKMVPASAQIAVLTVKKRSWELHIGHLNPVEHVPDEGISGVEGMLKNLGFYADRVAGIMTHTLREAVRTAQHWLGQEPTGEIDDQLKTELKAVYHGKKKL